MGYTESGQERIPFTYYSTNMDIFVDYTDRFILK
jgi:hypothetical protein